MPALKPGASILISDYYLLEPGLKNGLDERIMRRMAIVMLPLINAQELMDAHL